MLAKKRQRIRKALMCACVLIAMGSFSYFGVYVYKAYQKDKEVQRLNALKENERVASIYREEITEVQNAQTGEKAYFRVLDEYVGLYNQNRNLIGWLKIDGTEIDYPVVQTENEAFYLEHNLKNEPDKNGTLFLDKHCDVKKPSTNFIIYGHNMKSGRMFGTLSKYQSKEYYEKHKEIVFDTIYQKAVYEVMFVFRSRVYKEDEVAFKYYQFIDVATESEFDSYMQTMAEMSYYDTGVTAVFGDQLLSLSTCDYNEPEGRFVVVAKRVTGDKE